MATHNQNSSNSPKLLSMSALGQMGRFGNQLFQYAFLRICAEKTKSIVACPDWAGSKLFGLSHERVTQRLPPAIEAPTSTHSIFDAIPEIVAYIESLHDQPVGCVGCDAMDAGVCNLDLYGFFQYHTRHYLPHQELFRSLFQPTPMLQKHLDSALKRNRSVGRPLVGVHIRRGDYISNPRVAFAMSYRATWYANWLKQHYQEFGESPEVFVCSDDLANVLPAFRDHNTITMNDLSPDLPNSLLTDDLRFYLDFYALTQCDALLISNSTFSFVAAMLNERATRFIRPVWDVQQKFADFDPWDSDPLLWPKGDDSRLFKSTSEVLSHVHATQGWAAVIPCLCWYLPYSHIHETVVRSYLAYQADGGRGLLKSMVRFAGRKLRRAS
jgi:hypothetical protein